MSTHRQDPSLSCQAAAELFPWLINGSLEAGEKRALLDHVATCESCGVELDETAQAWGLLTQHIPSLALAEYGLGVEPEGLDRERIELHLASCPSCRAELEGVRADEVLDFQRARPSRAAKTRSGRTLHRIAGRRRWAVAAGLAAALVTGALLGSRLELGAASSKTELAAFSEDWADDGRAAGTGALFRDGFEFGRISSWSTSQDDDQTSHR